VRDRDAFLDMKERGVAYQRPQRYVDIVMPKNSAIGVILGGLSFVLAFAVVWYMWWLAIVAAVLAVLAVIGFSSNDDRDMLLPAGEIERIESRRLDDVARAPRAASGEETSALPGSPLAGTVS
jgi:cytochrome o ubiquinol oxidase subunit 1